MASAEPFSLLRWVLSRAGVPDSFPVELIAGLVLIATAYVGIASLTALIGIWAERKVAGRIQVRHGPNRVGPVGLLQSIADGVKLLTKEDLAPSAADRPLFRLAPYLAFVPVFAAFLAIPFGPQMTFEPRLAVGVFWILAILSVEVMGVILAGWASNNKWAVYGAMREACQMVSYEIPLGLSIVTAVVCAGTLNMVEMSHLQAGGIHTWLLFRNPFVLGAFAVYFVASLASNKRAPFDLPESESELVAGYHTEYSGLRFSFFFFAEYAGMFVVAAIQTALFLGGWNDPFGLLGYLHQNYLTAAGGPNGWGLLLVNVLAVGVFLAKCAVLIYVQMWVRWTLPRPRIDQVLYACVKVLLPMACALLLGAAVWQLLVSDRPGVPWRDYHPYAAAGWSGAGGALVTQIILATVGVGFSGLVVGYVGWAFVSGRNNKQRLTDPAPIETGAVAIPSGTAAAAKVATA
ncbi:MAG TPA: NADH-quinone oxidoreductase subunit NuoH [Humisphaera sp.]